MLEKIIKNSGKFLGGLILLGTVYSGVLRAEETKANDNLTSSTIKKEKIKLTVPVVVYDDYNSKENKFHPDVLGNREEISMIYEERRKWLIAHYFP